MDWLFSGTVFSRYPGNALGYLLKSKTPEGLLNTLAFTIFSVFGIFTLYQGLKLINTDVRSIPVLPILIAATIAFAGICVYLFLKREKKAKQQTKNEPHFVFTEWGLFIYSVRTQKKNSTHNHPFQGHPAGRSQYN